MIKSIYGPEGTRNSELNFDCVIGEIIITESWVTFIKDPLDDISNQVEFSDWLHADWQDAVHSAWEVVCTRTTMTLKFYDATTTEAAYQCITESDLWPEDIWIIQEQRPHELFIELN